jgi:steroid delta-isomerase-like uncharacterized protein
LAVSEKTKTKEKPRVSLLQDETPLMFYSFAKYFNLMKARISIFNKPTTKTMAATENSALVRRFIEEAFNQANFEGIADMLAPDYLHHDPTTNQFGSGIDGFKQMISLYRQAFPDLQITLEDQIATEDKVVDRWTGHGTHQGEFMGMAPTGRKITATGISIHRIAAGKIAETWNNYDALGMLQQLGVFPGQKQ